jgi:uncharacterized protein (TIGR02996 family)
VSDADALLAAILAQPDEDVPRLAYADWLDEHGGASDRARAEFVRVQIALARVPANTRDLDLEGHQKRLLALHRTDWLAPLQADGEPLPRGVAHGQFRRGFVEVVRMPAMWFATRAEFLFARAPVRELCVTRTTVEQLAALVANAYVPRLNALDLTDRGLGDPVARVLTQRPAVAALTRLRLRGCGLTDAAACRLADADFDWPLRELDVSLNPLSPYGVRVLRDRYGEDTVLAPGLA